MIYIYIILIYNIYIYIYVELYVYINIYIEYLINYNQLYINHIHFISIVEHFPLLLQVFVSAALDCPTGSIQVNLPWRSMAPVRNCDRNCERYPNIGMVFDGIGMGQVTYESTTPGVVSGWHPPSDHPPMPWILRGTEEFAPALEAMRSLVRFAQFAGWDGFVPSPWIRMMRIHWECAECTIFKPK